MSVIARQEIISLRLKLETVTVRLFLGAFILRSGLESTLHTRTSSHFFFRNFSVQPYTARHADIRRASRGMAIRRAKKKTNVVNDKRIKMCLRRYDTHVYTRLQAVSHNISSTCVARPTTAVRVKTKNLTSKTSRMTRHRRRRPRTPTCSLPSTTARCASWRPRIHTLHWYTLRPQPLWCMC